MGGEYLRADDILPRMVDGSPPIEAVWHLSAIAVKQFDSSFGRLRGPTLHELAGDNATSTDRTDTTQATYGQTGGTLSRGLSRYRHAQPAGRRSEPMTRLWLVERSYDDRNLISFTYATVDGTHQLRKELSMALLRRRDPMTAAIEVDEAELSAVDDTDRERFAAEATKMAAEHDPDDEI